ncbi:hypothetical protein [Natronobacterium gregoryi]|uniref:HD domain-containing protein n=2 Tax=Natronobacterium gregoryi TaxID=44930 RepID=L0AHP3_NATGS|nr:hypothetical protein [Natronobacterium gregoryi]AFZ72575.1 hypothetical protein Natgr_1364 [Natronobacterium gregoryi SP2]ELY71906.1 hypothetical protein C490_04512 [Natronobacterium gregoryi SP2]PLK19344.1 hypothetical protein CYV19_15355 [Natronobacterium gregoryi SP2]SFJ52342.1 hypothetical protein SAMN05443661_13617 [Natronobacterium gregoryi]
MTDRRDASGDASRPLEALEALEALEDEVATLKRVVQEGDEPRRIQFEAAASRLQDVFAETNGGHGTINTHSGEQITPLSPDPEQIDLADVAHALSNLSRFTGQGKHFYSVARHAVHVSHEVESRGGSREAQRWGLLHDASEAYFADVPAPVKRSLPGYTRAEKEFQAAVREAFDLELAVEDERLVDGVDGDIARYELSIHFPANHESPGLECEHDDLDGSVDDAELYRRRARELGL